MAEVVKDGGIDDLPDGKAFDIFCGVEAKVDFGNLCSDGRRDVHGGEGAGPHHTISQPSREYLGFIQEQLLPSCSPSLVESLLIDR
jgi:hypothetical protein